MEEAAAGKARLPTVESLTDGRKARKVGDACERSLVSRRTTVKNLVTKQCDPVLHALRYMQPMNADERISDVIGALQVEDQQCRRVHHLLESAREVGRLGCRPARCCRSPAGSAAERRLASSWHGCRNSKYDEHRWL